MTAPHVVVVGGGLAGLSAAIACQDAGVRITLLESRARLGGATWSTERRGLVVDNGQHVFLRCCTAYRTFLRRLGVEDKVVLQPRLAVPVREPGGRTSWIRRSALPAPAHLAPSLLRFAPLAWSERLRAARTVLRLRALDLADPALDARRFGDWLRAQGEGDAAIDGFWDLLIRPTLNRPAREASLALAAKVFQTGLLTDADGADLGWSAVPLQMLHADPAERILREAGADVRRRAKVTRLEPAAAGRHAAVWIGPERIAADAVVLAVPHDAAAELLPAGGKVDPEGLAALGTSPILNLHVVFDRPVLELPFVAALGSPLQWIFDRTESAGLHGAQYLAVSISAADAYEGLATDELRAIFVRAFHELLPASRAASLCDFFVTREPAATFRQVPGTKPLRAGADSGWPALALAGAWTDTGWPATMEGAVRSGRAAAQHTLDTLRRHAVH
ncbi:MAG TPA: hydroxysqualene dehydroxylase HpnE [Myxococcota bacterium]|nr:hydroxysqualene dehydroxylase HpnE [Myxococcota bacterium]